MPRLPVLAPLAALLLAACQSRPAATPASPLSARLDSLVEESMRDGKLPGLAITIVRGDAVVLSRGYGMADVAQAIPMTDTTPVVIGSTSKTFTAFALMQLVEAGRLALDSSAARGLPSLAGTAPADPRFARITTRQLLTNVSGLPVGFSGEAYDMRDTASDALVRLMREEALGRRLDFAPGEGYAYSNRGFSLAALVVQDVAGMPYEDYMATRVFAPLGMTQTTARWWAPSAVPVVQGYREGVDGRPLARPYAAGRGWTGSGMIRSTSRDVGRYLQAMLHDGRAADGTPVLSAAGVREILRPQQKAESELGGPTMYGLGWEIGELQGTPMATKGGSVGSMGSLFVLLPAQRIGIAMLFNLVDYGKVQLLQNVLAALLGGTPSPYRSAPAATPVPPTGVTLPRARLAALAGTYHTRTGVLRTTLRGDTLAARFEGNDLWLEPASDSTFVMRSPLREQEGSTLAFRRCGATLCLWRGGDSTGVRR